MPRRCAAARCGVVGNPALRPAFRVTRGRARENGFAASRARRATRPTPEQVSVPCGHGADINSRRVCWGITRRPLRPRSPAVLGHEGELGNPLGSRAGTPAGPTEMAGERGATTESTRRARGYGRIRRVSGNPRKFRQFEPLVR